MKKTFLFLLTKCNLTYSVVTNSCLTKLLRKLTLVLACSRKENFSQLLVKLFKQATSLLVSDLMITLVNQSSNMLSACKYRKWFDRRNKKKKKNP